MRKMIKLIAVLTAVCTAICGVVVFVLNNKTGGEQ